MVKLQRSICLVWHADPAYYGLDVRSMSSYLDWRSAEAPLDLTEGIYCISATMLQGLYLESGGPWTLEYERQYQEAKAAVEGQVQRGVTLDQEEPALTLDRFRGLFMAKLFVIYAHESLMTKWVIPS